MAQLLLAVFLLVFGFNLVIGVSLPTWIIGLVTVSAGILLLTVHFRAPSRSE